MADVDKIKGSFYIYSNGEYVVLPGTKLYILRTDGSLVNCRSDLRHAGRITFLSGNRMLLCSSKKEFHMIDLHDGSDHCDEDDETEETQVKARIFLAHPCQSAWLEDVLVEEIVDRESDQKHSDYGNSEAVCCLHVL